MMDNSVNDTTTLEAKPFSTLEQLYRGIKNLEKWPDVTKLRECTDYVYGGRDIEHLYGVDGQLPKLNRDRLPRTIVCHDMMGGYLEDRFIDGSQAHKSYLFYHWSVIDTFIYFSHHFVTIPPYGWINTAHNHGVKVLGTVITENTDGEIIWEEILSSMEETRKFADTLISLAKYYKFDGWLLNIENKITVERIQTLLYFVQYLTVGMHTEIPDSEVIWYDSVTVDGQLKWQNQLNDHNKDFFENCDGIFLNYNWTDAGLEVSRSIAELTSRVHDVYVGLDVWGRGCPGGGGFNSIEALRRIREHNLSVAIFGAGWTHEYFNAKEFKLIENIFWAQLTPYLYIHVPIYENVTFSSTFCQGSGERYYYTGKYDEISSVPFYNLSWQEPQISIPNVHLRFTRVDCPMHNDKNKDSNDGNTSDNKIPICTYETSLQVIKVSGHDIDVEHKSLERMINAIHFSVKHPYNGGGCIKITANSPQAYHRLFLLYLEFNTDIQLITIHHHNRNYSQSYGDGIEHPEHPILILKNNQSVQRIEPYESYDSAKWKESYYLARNIQTISEIGISFAKEGTYYIGKIQIRSLTTA